MSRAPRGIISLIRAGLVGAASIFTGTTAATHPDPKFSYETEHQRLERLAMEKRQKKLEVIGFGSVLPMPETALTSPLIIAASIFSKTLTDAEDKKRLVENIARTYAISIMQPLMDFIALSCLGKTNSHASDKRFKFIASEELTDVHPGFSGAGGVYTRKHTAFVELPDLKKLDEKEHPKAIDDFWSTALHEATHFTMVKIFGGSATPPHGTEFNEIVNSTISRIEAMDPKKNASSFAYNRMKDAITDYPYTEYGAEFIARIPEIISHDPEGGYKWLQENTPELLKCFEEEINPAINDFLRKRAAGEYLTTTAKPHTTAKVKAAATAGLAAERTDTKLV